MSIALKVHLVVDTEFQQEISEPPDIVQEHAEHEGEQPNPIVLRGRLR